MSERNAGEITKPASADQEPPVVDIKTRLANIQAALPDASSLKPEERRAIIRALKAETQLARVTSKF